VDITDEIVSKAAFGNLTPEEYLEATSKDHLIEFGDRLLAIITRLNQQISQFNLNMRARDESADDASWRVRTGALQTRCIGLWASLRPRYRALRAEVAGSGPGYRRAVQAHQIEVLESFEPTDADRRLWKVLDGAATANSDGQSDG
jgi:hypothetical protein